MDTSKHTGPLGVRITLFIFGAGFTLENMNSKACVKWPLKNRQNKGLNDNGSLMKVESIAECSPWSILEYF